MRLAGCLAVKLAEWVKFFREMEAKGIRVFHVSALKSVSSLDSKALSVALWRLERRGLIRRVARGWICFGDCSIPEIVKAVFPSAYLSLEWALHYHEVLDQEVRVVTLVWLGKTKVVQSREYLFELHKIKRELYFGFNVKDMIAEPEKALLDLVYFRGKIPPELNLEFIDFSKLAAYAERYPPKVRWLLSLGLHIKS